VLFRVLVFILLVALGYYYSRKIQGSRLTIALVSALLVLLLAVFFVFGKKLWAMFGFSMYLMIIVLGFAAGILAGLGLRGKKLEQADHAVPVKIPLKKTD